MEIIITVVGVIGGLIGTVFGTRCAVWFPQSANRCQATLQLLELQTQQRCIPAVLLSKTRFSLVRVLGEMRGEPRVEILRKTKMKNQRAIQEFRNQARRLRRLFMCTLVGLISISVAFGQASGNKLQETVVQTGHSDIITSVAFSPDGKYVASSSKDQSIKIWEVSTGLELRTFYGHQNTVRKVVFSPDGHTLASAGTGDGTVRLWKVESGEVWKILKGKTEWPRSDIDTADFESVTDVAFSPNGKIIASCNYKAIKLWDAETGELLKTFVNHSDWIYSLVFSSDGKQIASAGRDKEIRISDTSTGQVSKILDDQAVNREGYRVSSLEFSPDDTRIVSADYQGKIKIWDIKSGRKLRVFEVDDSQRPVLTEPAPVVQYSDKEIDSVRFLSESILASAGGSGTITLWNLSNGQKRILAGHTRRVSYVAFSPKNNMLASCSEDKTIRLWNIENEKEVRILRGKTSRVTAVAFAHQTPFLAVAYNDSMINLWNLEKGETKMLNAGAISAPNPKNAFAEGFIEFNYGGLTTIAFSPDDRILATGNRDIKLWETTSGKLLRTIQTEDVSVTAFAFSPNGEMLASNSIPDGTIRLWNTKSGEKIKDLVGHRVPVNSISFSPDGKTLASGGRDKTIKLWEVESKSEKEKATFTEHAEPIVWVMFSIDGAKLLSTSEDRVIMAWDLIKPEKIASFLPTETDLRQKVLQIVPRAKNDDATIYGAKFSLSADPSGSVKISDRRSRELLITLFRLDTEWALVTPNGLFDGSPAAWKKITWRFNNNTFDHVPVEAFFREYWRPGLLQEIVAGKTQPPPKDISAVDIRQPQVRIMSIDGQATIEKAVGEPLVIANAVSNRNVEVIMEVIDNAKGQSQGTQLQTSGAKDLRLFRNGSLVRLWQGDIFEKRSGCVPKRTRPNEPTRAICKANVSVVAGDNKFTAYAFNSQDVKSIDAELVATGAATLKRSGTLYVLAVGVNNYANRAFDLTYAVADAEDFGAELRMQQEKLKNYQRTEIIPIYNEQATKEKIIKTLSDLATKVQPEDAMVVYFAGHGTVGSCLSEVTQQPNAKDRFYLVPHDLGYKGEIPERCEQQILDTVAQHSISDLDLEAAFQKIDAGQMLLVIDACNSGQALESEEKRRGPMNSKGLAQLAYEKGMYILTAAESFQEAKADKRIAKGHGYLTYALIEEGIRQRKAADKEGNVMLRDWVDYAVQRVPIMQQTEAAERREFVKKKTASANNDEEEIQTPRVFYRREPDLTPFVVARP